MSKEFEGEKQARAAHRLSRLRQAVKLNLRHRLYVVDVERRLYRFRVGARSLKPTHDGYRCATKRARYLLASVQDLTAFSRFHDAHLRRIKWQTKSY